MDGEGVYNFEDMGELCENSSKKGLKIAQPGSIRFSTSVVLL